MTAEEVRATTFQQSPLAWRGYSEQEVDLFVARAAQSLDEAQRDTIALRAEVDRLRNFYRRHGTDIDHSVDQRSEWRAAAEPSRLIAEAQRYIQTQVAQADIYAEMVTTEGQPQAEETLLHARLRSKIVVEDMLRTFLSRSHDRQRAQAEVEQLAQWVSALADALWAQTDAMSQVLQAQLAHRTTLRQPATLEPSSPE